MAYIPPQLAIDTERENQRVGFLNQAMGHFGDLAKSRKDALLLEQQKKDKLNAEANGFAEKGVSGDMVAEAQKTGDYTGIRNFMAGNAKTEMEYKRSQIDKDNQVKDSTIKRNNAEATDPDKRMSFEEKEAIKAKYKAQNQQEKQPAQNEFAAAGYSKRARQAEEEFAKLPPGTGTDLKSRLFNILPNEMAPENLQLLDQSKRNFISANLRKESGAAISDAEYSNEDKKYFPQPGDTEAVMQQKARAREQAMLNLEAEGARALPRVGDAQRAPIDIKKKIQTYSPEQAAQRLAELEAKAAGR